MEKRSRTASDYTQTHSKSRGEVDLSTPLQVIKTRTRPELKTNTPDARGASGAFRLCQPGQIDLEEAQQ
jgi:hypothetical protein